MLTRTRVKICGVTRDEDAQLAAFLGADSIGLNFWKPGARFIQPQVAALIAKNIPPFISRVAIFLDAKADEIQDVLSTVDLDMLQFHGDEPADFCASFGMPYIKALRATNMEAIRAGIDSYGDAAAILLDTPAEGVFGGAGVAFDWAVVPEMEQKLILAGGLQVGNVGDAITTVRPYAVDVCTGVEASKGVKDPELMKRFFAAVAAADQECSDS